MAPAEMQASGGVTLSARPDKSILAGGTVAEGTVYEITLPAPDKPVTGLRLEALTDPSLPNGGPGRDIAGNFALTNLTVLPATTTAGQPRREIVLRAVRADFTQHGFRVRPHHRTSLDA